MAQSSQVLLSGTLEDCKVASICIDGCGLFGILLLDGAVVILLGRDGAVVALAVEVEVEVVGARVLELASVAVDVDALAVAAVADDPFISSR